jgi:hypothetical protein
MPVDNSRVTGSQRDNITSLFMDKGYLVVSGDKFTVESLEKVRQSGNNLPLLILIVICVTGIGSLPG